jgi:hypothetical protein
MIVLGVLVIRRYELFDRFLKSVERGTLRPDRYVVVDNGAKLGQEIDAGVVDLPDNTTLISPGRNLGVSGGFNKILEASSDADRIIVANDDLIYGPETLEHVVGVSKQHDFVRAPGYLNYAITPKVVERIGFFDENFFCYFEDNDYDRRLRLTNLTHADPQGIEVPGKPGEPKGIEIRHGIWNEDRKRFEGSSSLTCLTEKQQGEFSRKFGESGSYYLSKWGGPPGKEKFTEPFDGHTPFGWELRPITVGGEVVDEYWLRA